MALGAIAIGAVSTLAGLQLSLWQDTPAGPSIIVAAATLFASLALLARRR
jgi:zinc transport system permease protein